MIILLKRMKLQNKILQRKLMFSDQPTESNLYLFFIENVNLKCLLASFSLIIIAKESAGNTPIFQLLYNFHETKKGLWCKMIFVRDKVHCSLKLFMY